MDKIIMRGSVKIMGYRDSKHEGFISELEELAAKLSNALANFVDPTCSKCGESGNIFEYRGVPAQTAVLFDTVIEDEELPKNKIFIIYCIKCGNIAGTAGKV